MREFGNNLGIAYQLKDDLNDRYSDSSQLGKPTGQDHHKITSVDILGPAKLEQKVKEYHQAAINHLPEKPRQNPEIMSLVDKILEL